MNAFIVARISNGEIWRVVTDAVHETRESAISSAQSNLWYEYRSNYPRANDMDDIDINDYNEHCEDGYYVVSDSDKIWSQCVDADNDIIESI